MDRADIKNKVILLRQGGRTYSEIKKILKIDIPKSTLSTWCGSVELPPSAQERIKNQIKQNLVKARQLAVRANKQRREEYILGIINKNKEYGELSKDKTIAKLCLAMLYLGEGGKSLKQGKVYLGNSDPKIIGLFLSLMRYCYIINEAKFRCTVQCRADQNSYKLVYFWSKVTQIPPSQFYKPQVDKRTIGKPSRKSNYKGVCRIDYLSAHTQLELIKICDIFIKGARSLGVKR